MDRKNMFFVFIGWSGLTILLSAFFLTLFGTIDLKIEEQSYISSINTIIINLFLFHISIFALVSIKLRYSIKFRVCTTICYIPVYIMSAFIPMEYSFIATIVFPFIYVLLVNKIKNNICPHAIIYWIIICAYQIISGFIKIEGFNIAYNKMSTTGYIILSVDLFIFYAYLIKEGNRYELVGKHILLPKIKRIFRNEKSREKGLDLSDLNNRQKFLFACMAMGYQIIQLLIVLSIGFLNNMFAEIICMILMFWVGRKILGNSWHSEKLWFCSAVTFLSFYILTKINLPFEISLFSTVLTTSVFTYILFYMGNKADRLQELENKYNSDFSRFNLSHEMAEFAKDWLVNGYSEKELIDKYKIASRNTLNSRKRRIKEKMNTI